MIELAGRASICLAASRRVVSGRQITGGRRISADAGCWATSGLGGLDAIDAAGASGQQGAGQEAQARGLAEQRDHVVAASE